ncbi:hypothetical protein FQZ97_638700 [compost metagenome]
MQARRSFLHLGRRLQITAGEVVGFAIVQALIGEQVVIHQGAFQPGGQRLDGGCGRRCHAAQQCQGGVPDQARAALLFLLLNGFSQFAAVILHGVEERAPFAAELIGQLGFHAAGKTSPVMGLGLPLDDVLATALDEVTRQFLTQRVGGCHAALQGGKAWIEQRQQVVEGGFVTGVRGGGQQDQVSLRVTGKALQQLEAQLLACAAAGAGVGFVNDDAFGGGSEKLFAVAFALDVVQADDHHRMMVEQAHTMRKVAFDARSGCRGQRDGMQVETGIQLTLPLFDQVWRAEDGQAGDFATVHQFAGDQAGFDGLADTHVIGNQQAHRGQAQGHQQRHKLVAARLDSDVAEGAKRAGAGAQGQAQGIAQQQRGGVVAGACGIGPVEGGRFDGMQFQLGDQRDAFVIGTA